MPLRSLIGSVLLLVLLGWVGELSADITETIAEAGLPAGTTTVVPGNSVQIYSVRLNRTEPPGPAVSQLMSIAITISDLTVPTGLLAGDFTQLNLIRSADAVLDGGDPVIGTQPVVAIGGLTTLTPTVAEAFGNPETKSFFITAVMAAGAVGKSFKVGAAGGDIVVAVPAAPAGRGTGFAALDANRVTVVPGGGGPPGGGTIRRSEEGGIPDEIDVPVGGEWLVALLVLGYGLYRLR